MVAYRMGLEMATKRSKAMANSTDNSMTVKSLTKNICDKQAVKLISLALNQNIPNMVTRVYTDKPSNSNGNSYLILFFHIADLFASFDRGCLSNMVNISTTEITTLVSVSGQLSEQPSAFVNLSPISSRRISLKRYQLHREICFLHSSLPSFNQNIFHSAVFFLTGIPGFETYHAWISILFCCLFAIAISGNGMVLFVIITESSLHEPMYYFLSMLSFTDLGLCFSTLVTMVGIFWFNAREISFDLSNGHMFFIHGFTLMESLLLLAMVFDRYTAICNPLRYATILTNSRIIRVGFAIVIRVTTVVVPLLLLLKHTEINSAFGLAIVISTGTLDSVLILLSYVLIIHSVPSIASPEEWKKAFGTCVSHISAVAIFYIPMMSLSLVPRPYETMLVQDCLSHAENNCLVNLMQNLEEYKVKEVPYQSLHRNDKNNCNEVRGEGGPEVEEETGIFTDCGNATNEREYKFQKERRKIIGIIS
eukprot:bmy_13072T0